MIRRPFFTENDQNRVKLLELLDQLKIKQFDSCKNFKSLVLHEIYEQTGADWAIIRRIHEECPLHNSDFIVNGWFDEGYLLKSLARYLRTESNDFAVFASLFTEFCITLESLAVVVSESKKLQQFGLQRDDLLERIKFVSTANESNILGAAPLFLGYCEAATHFAVPARNADDFANKKILLDTRDEFWLDLYGFDFRDTRVIIEISDYIEVELSVKINSPLIRHELSFDFVEDSEQGAPVLNGRLRELLKSLINASMRLDAEKCQFALMDKIPLTNSVKDADSPSLTTD